MRVWIPVAFVLLIVAAYALFYMLDSVEAQGANSFGIANIVGLVTVVVGVVVAGAVMKRTTRP